MSTAGSGKPRSRTTSRMISGGAAVLGLVIVGFGWIIPSQFKSIPVSVLGEAGRGTPGVSEFVLDQLDAGRPGVAELVARAARQIQYPAGQELVGKVNSFLAENVDLGVWGEANPYLTTALPNAVANSGDDGDRGVIRQFLPKASRASLESYLSGSRNATTRAILATKDLTTWREFLPVFSAGGAPLEASILLAAALVQSDELGSGAMHELRDVADEALRTGQAERIELFYLDLLSLGRRYNWSQLVALTRGANSLDTLAKLRHLHQVASDDVPVIMAAVAMTGRADAVTDYVMRYGPLGVHAVSYALYHGSGSLDLLLRQQLPPDGDLTLPPDEKQTALARSALDPFVRFALQKPTEALAAKFVAYLLGGLLLFIAAERVSALHRLELSTFFTFLARCIGAGVVCLLLLVLNEPYLAFGSKPSGYQLRLVVPVIGTSTVEKMNESTHAFPLDTATLMSITFFFLLQALVYVICLLKLKDIERKEVSEPLKLKLAENEENLFDSGLYVGIAGTSAALVLQVLGVIQANLLAAYSSNLFGILCVALIKIRHVRPFKRRIILRIAESSMAESSRAG